MESLTNLIKDELMSEGYSFSVEKFNVRESQTNFKFKFII